MAAAEIRASSDQKKLIWAVALGVVALIAIWWTFVGFGSSKPGPRAAVSSSPSPSPSAAKSGSTPTKGSGNLEGVDLATVTKVVYEITLPNVPEPRRNIFAFYVPPPPPSPHPPSPPPPAPPPPWLLASISPNNVYAKTEDFSLEARGDKFTPDAQIVIDSRPFPTKYISPQQVSATVPAAVIANPGPRQIVVRSSDNALSSNPLSLNVAAPPTPNFTYVGYLAKPRHIGDTAFLVNKSNKETASIQRGDILDGRFRVTSISDRELVMVDTTLKIKHTLPLTMDGEKGPYPIGRPTPKVQSEDDEP